MRITVKVDTAALRKMRQTLTRNPQLQHQVRTDWSTILRAFVRQRFAAASRGNGVWQALSARTIRRRRGGGVNAAILRDTGALFASTQPTIGDSHSLIQSSAPRMLGFTADINQNTELGRIASFHQQGGPRLPQREILVVPPANIISRMATRARDLVVKHLNG